MRRLKREARHLRRAAASRTTARKGPKNRPMKTVAQDYETRLDQPLDAYFTMVSFSAALVMPV